MPDPEPVAATGAAGSVAFSEATRQPVLLVIPVVSSVFGMLYFDHRSAISNIGEYIQNELAPAVRVESGWSDAIGWADAICSWLAEPQTRSPSALSGA